MRKLAVAGINGQIGSFLARRMEADWQIAGFDITPNPYDQLDALDEDAVSGFFSRHADAAAVINCLGDSDTADALSFINILDVSKNHFSAILHSNLISTFIIMREYLRFCSGNEGNIISIASLYSTVSPNPNIYGESIKHPGYVASKFGLVGLTKYVAVLVAGQGVKVNCISPGAVLGTKGVSGEFLENYRKLTPSQNGVELDNIYQVVKMLCDNKNITGQNIVIDGGYGLW